LEQVETGETGIILFLQHVSGDGLPSGNGGTNEPGTKPYLMLANTVEGIAARKHLLANALVALTQGSLVRFDGMTPASDRLHRRDARTFELTRASTPAAKRAI
jgi:hypothetical protein